MKHKKMFMITRNENKDCKQFYMSADHRHILFYVRKKKVLKILRKMRNNELYQSLKLYQLKTVYDIEGLFWKCNWKQIR